MIRIDGIRCRFCGSMEYSIVAHATIDLTGPVCERCLLPAAGNGFGPRLLGETVPLSPSQAALIVRGKAKLATAENGRNTA